MLEVNVLEDVEKVCCELWLGVKMVVMLKFIILEDVEAIRCEWWLGVEMVGMLVV